MQTYSECLIKSARSKMSKLVFNYVNLFCNNWANSGMCLKCMHMGACLVYFSIHMIHVLIYCDNYDGPYMMPFTHTFPCEIYVDVPFSGPRNFRLPKPKSAPGHSTIGGIYTVCHRGACVWRASCMVHCRWPGLSPSGTLWCYSKEDDKDIG